ncbi:hypothetical protein C2S51_003977 [Perilla frutescens var. frutescens]|nr:hypothetical protein C2S51_003977 [Perilla frutescens var. frutescens]
MPPQSPFSNFTFISRLPPIGGHCTRPTRATNAAFAMSLPIMESPPPSQSLTGNTAPATIDANTKPHLGFFIFDCSRDDEAHSLDVREWEWKIYTYLKKILVTILMIK